MVFETDPVPARLHQSITIEILDRPPSANARPGNVHARARVTGEWRETAGKLATAHRLAWESRHGQKWEPLRLATLVVTFVLPTKGRYDWDNLVSTLKPELDGIVDAGLIVDDSVYVLPHVYTEFEHRPGVTATRFEINEIPT